MKECVNKKCQYNNGNLKNGCQYLNDITKCKEVSIIENEIQDNLSSSCSSNIRRQQEIIDSLKNQICQAHMAGQHNQSGCDASWSEAYAYWSSVKKELSI